MKFTRTTIAGAFIADLEPITDEREYFARPFCRREFAAHGLNPELVQCKVSLNRRRGTLRGDALAGGAARGGEARALHPGNAPRRHRRPLHRLAHIRAAHGRAALRRERRMLYVPEGCAHGFLTLEDDTEVLYQMSAFYASESARGVRFDDPAFGIRWPAEVTVISEPDRGYPDWAPV